jgi:hypothetical protein
MGGTGAGPGSAGADGDAGPGDRGPGDSGPGDGAGRVWSAVRVEGARLVRVCGSRADADAWVADRPGWEVAPVEEFDRAGRAALVRVLYAYRGPDGVWVPPAAGVRPAGGS